MESEATWNSRSTGVAWSDVGADGTGSHTGTPVGVLGCTVGTHNLDVTTTLQSWSDGNINAGWVLVNDLNNDGINMRTSEHATAADRPLLTVDYIPAVFYSVGTDTSDLKTGTPNITIAAGVATLDTAQTNDIGVGDVIDHDTDNKLVYIWEVISDTQFRVQTATGALPANVSGVAVNSIKRAFNSVAGAVAGSSNGSHLNNNDLTALALRLTWVCYDDAFFDVSSTTSITGYVTDATHFITLTVAGASQVATGASQRHLGIAGSGVRFEASAGGMDFLAVSEPYTRIEWVEFDGNDINTTQGVLLDATADNATVRNVILHNLRGGVATANGVFIEPGNTGSRVQNAIVYAYDGDGVHVSGTNATVANSTFYLGRTTPSSNSVQTDTGATASVYNVLAVGPETDFFENDAPGLSLYNCISTDASASTYDVSGSFKTGVSPATEFISYAGTIHLHLRAGAEAIDFGIDLSASFTDDIDDETRPMSSAWDVGADESVFTSTITNYRSIGSAPDLVNQGTITITLGSITVTKTGGLGWLSQNRGRGDVLIEGVNEYMILAVDSDNQLRLAAPATASYVGGTYTIARQHLDFDAWYDCVDNTTVCPHFPVGSSSLVTDDRSEVGIAYNDSPFLLTADVRFQGATTDATHTIRLTVDRGNRHNGVPGAGVVVDAQQMPNEVSIRDSNWTLEWLELIGCKGTTSLSAVEVWGIDGDTATNVLLQNLLIHDFDDGRDNSGIDLAGTNTLVGKIVTIRNTMIWDGDQEGIEGDEPLDVVTVENVSIDGMQQRGIWAGASSFIIRNTIVTGGPTIDFDAATGSMVGTNNTSSDASAATYFANPQTGVTAASVFVTPNIDLHLKAGANVAVDQGVDLGSNFWNDVDNQKRPAGATWDRGADERDATTAVELTSLAASPAPEAVELRWETGSELNNLGFHVYRSTSATGGYERITARPIPGLGSSPVGARYTYRDDGLDNGTTYYYELEDIETTGATKRHGPVSATPGRATTPAPEMAETHIAYGDPSANTFRVLKRTQRQLVLELTTEGFYAEPVEDGSVALRASGLESLHGEIPVKRTWVDAVAGRKVRIASVRAERVETFQGLSPSAGGVPDIVASRNGVVRPSLRRRRARAAFHHDAARIVDVGFQGEQKKALLELSPLTTDASGRLVLARRLVVTVSFRGRERAERSDARRYRARRGHDPRHVITQLRTTDAGLYRVRYEDVLSGGRGVPARRLRLSRQGKAVAYHLTPNANRFGPGSVLYFVSAGGDANPFGPEAVYELELGGDGKTMELVSARPSGSPLSLYRHRDDYEQDRYYQSGLVDAPDLWLWDALFAPQTKSYPLTVHELAGDAPSRVSVWLQGASDFETATDHHVRVRVNGTLVAERSWDGKRAVALDAELSPGVLHQGDNVLEIENVGDTGAAYSMILLDRYALEYSRLASALGGRIDGVWEEGVAELTGLATNARVVDVSGDAPRWLRGVERGAADTLSFQAESGHRYLAMPALEPVVTAPRRTRLKSTGHRADYILIGPEAFLDAAAPLLQLRRSEGLKTASVSIEDVYSEFGFGEPTPRAVKDFLTYAYHGQLHRPRRHPTSGATRTSSTPETFRRWHRNPISRFF